MSLLMRTLILLDQALCHLTLIISLEAPTLIRTTLGGGLQHMNLVGSTNIQFITRCDIWRSRNPTSKVQIEG